MIEINIKLIPFGIRERERSIGKITIINDGSGDTFKGNYKYEIEDSQTKISGHYDGYPRDKGILRLLKAILNKSITEE